MLKGSVEHVSLIKLDAVGAEHSQEFRPKTSFAPLGRKRKKGPQPFFLHPLSTGSASGRFADAPLHPWLHPFAPLGLPLYDAGHGRSLPPPQGSFRQ